RRILVDFARSRQTHKRGRDANHLSLDEAGELSAGPQADFVAMDEALKALAVFDARKSQIVELRFFGGLTVQETAEALKISPTTVKREWAMDEVWLHRELSKK